MLHSFSLSEQQSLLHTNGNVQGEPLLASYHNGHASNEPLSSNGLDTKRNLGAFRSEGLPIWRAVFLMVNAAVGAGILNFPQAFAKCGGVINGIVIQLVGHLFTPQPNLNVPLGNTCMRIIFRIVSVGVVGIFVNNAHI